MNITGQTRILKNDKGVYKIALANKEAGENGEEKTIFMNINIGFKKGVELKNKSKIDIKNGFLTFYQIETDEEDENGKKIVKRFPKIMVMDFELLEEGTDELQKTKDYSKTTKEEPDVFIGYSSVDDLPF